jgi:hypothetical protein
MVEIVVVAEAQGTLARLAATADVVKFAFILGDYYELRNY